MFVLLKELLLEVGVAAPMIMPLPKLFQILIAVY